MADDWGIIDGWKVDWPPDDPRYTVALEARLVGDRYEIVRVEINGTNFGESSSAIRSGDLRLPLRELLNSRLAQIRSDIADGGVTGLVGETWDVPPMAKTRRLLTDGQSSRPGRPPLYDRAHYEGVAKTYAAALRDGRPPTRAVVDEYDVSKSTAMKWVARCRQPDLGLLPQTTRGSAKAPDHKEV